MMKKNAHRRHRKHRRAARNAMLKQVGEFRRLVHRLTDLQWPPVTDVPRLLAARAKLLGVNLVEWASAVFT